jgi:CheY-like chemotaxis protein
LPDDDEDVRALIVDTLRGDGHYVLEAHDGAELVECLRDALDDLTVRPDVIVTDVLMPNLSGLGVRRPSRSQMRGIANALDALRLPSCWAICCHSRRGEMRPAAHSH